MNRYSCRLHQHPSKANCPQCKPLISTAPLSDKELLAQRLAVFLGVNDVETYVSERGYRFKKITISPRFAPWRGAVGSPGLQGGGGVRQSFTVSVKLPGANDCLWKHWRTFRIIKQSAQREISVAIRNAKLKPMEYASITFEWREPDQKRDFDNIMFAQKFVLDALVACQILRDDGWEYVTEIRHVVVMNPALPGVHVTLEDRR